METPAFSLDYRMSPVQPLAKLYFQACRPLRCGLLAETSEVCVIFLCLDHDHRHSQVQHQKVARLAAARQMVFEIIRAVAVTAHCPHAAEVELVRQSTKWCAWLRLEHAKVAAEELAEAVPPHLRALPQGSGQHPDHVGQA